MIYIIVLLEVLDQAAFHEFETKAISIMAKHNGKLISAFEPNTNESSTKKIDEIHYLEFATIEDFKNYRTDPELLTLSDLRKQAIANTTVYVSGKIKKYT